ncbi:DUF2752 domain-containing protein [Pedobacter sp. UC225_65]|uniref:DUF2752 domain-containing protein n=1 Tax=Pedobacter sp. UC225_65 TaxID=3350173 RepID=UPI00366FA8F2
MRQSGLFFDSCPFKYLTHLDCPGCGFQRAVLALLQGNLTESFHLYPPAIPFLVSALATLTTYTLKLDKNSKTLKTMYVATGIIMVINYTYKIITHQLH